MTSLFAEKFLVPFIPIATVAGIGGSCLYLYSDEVFGPGSGYDIFIVAQSESLSSQSNAELYKELPVETSTQTTGNLATIGLFSLPVFTEAASAGTPSLPGAGTTPPASEPTPAVPPVKKERNYQCDISTESDKPVNKSCYITKKFDGPETANTSKKWINLSHIGIPTEYDYLIQSFDKPIIEVPSAVTKEELKAKDNYFVIQVTESLFNQIKWEEGQTLNISPLGNEEEYFGKLKPLFAVYADYVGIATEYVLTKVENISNLNPEEGDAEKTEVSFSSSGSGGSSSKSEVKNDCWLNGPVDTTNKSTYSCEFLKFSDSTHTGEGYWYKSVTFDGNLTPATKIEKDKYYLVKFDQKFFARRISNMEISYLVPGSGSETSLKPVVVTTGTAYPVVVIGSDTDRKLFILTKN